MKDVAELVFKLQTLCNSKSLHFMCLHVRLFWLLRGGVPPHFLKNFSLVTLQLGRQAGLPAGVLNVVTSSRSNAPSVGKELCENPIVKKISFTGSTGTGKVLDLCI